LELARDVKKRLNIAKTLAAGKGSLCKNRHSREKLAPGPNGGRNLVFAEVS
jgi:hypothetical protein